jgi:hypothetical protein
MVNEPYLNSLIQASIGRQCVSRLPYLQEETEALSLAVQTWEQARTGKWNELLQQLRTTQCHGKATEAGITDPAANRAFLLAMNLDDPADEPLITAALRDPCWRQGASASPHPPSPSPRTRQCPEPGTARIVPRHPPAKEEGG